MGRTTNLNRILVCEEVDDLECMRDNADSQELLAIVATLHHQTKRVDSEPRQRYSYIFDQPVHKAFNNRHLGLLELLLGITAGGMGKVNSVTNLDVIS